MEKQLSSSAAYGKKDQKDHKARRKDYEDQKRRRAEHYLVQAPEIRTGVLKFRGSLKSWHKYWCVLKPGMLFYFDETHRHKWCGTLLLEGGQVVERPSKKEGFGFKFYHPLRRPIHCQTNPSGEALTEAWFTNLIFPTDYMIMRSATEEEGHGWMHDIGRAIELGYEKRKAHDAELSPSAAATPGHHFEHPTGLGGGTFGRPYWLPESFEDEEWVLETPSLALGDIDSADKGTVWSKLKSFAADLDVTRKTLPARLHAPLSTLECFSEQFRRCSLLGVAASGEDPAARLKAVCQWYLSVFAPLRTAGMRVALPALVGEVFRCAFRVDSPDDADGLHAYFVAEQVTEDTMAFWASCRPAGWAARGQLTTKLAFLGNAFERSFEGEMSVTLLGHEEEFAVTLPRQLMLSLVLGKQRTVLRGATAVTCAKSDASATFLFQQDKVSATLAVAGAEVAKLSGAWAAEVSDGEAAFNNNALPLTMPDMSQHILAKDIVTPQTLVPASAQSRFCDSGAVWASAAGSIKTKDFDKADAALAQMDLAHSDAPAEPSLFVEEEGAWQYKHASTAAWEDSDVYERMVRGAVTTVVASELPGGRIPDPLPARNAARSPARFSRRPSVSSPGYEKPPSAAPGGEAFAFGLSARQPSVPGPEFGELEKEVKELRARVDLLQEQVTHPMLSTHFLVAVAVILIQLYFTVLHSS